MTLTEQWKKGELKEGWYYIEVNEPFDKIHKDISYYSSNSFDIEIDGNYIIEVLAPVPSYEEWKQLRKFLEEFNALDVAKENQQLKLIIKRTKASGNYPSKVSQYKARITELTEENQQLKELLKECRECFLINDYFGDSYIVNVAKKIDNAIGEKNNGN